MVGEWSECVCVWRVSVCVCVCVCVCGVSEGVWGCALLCVESECVCVCVCGVSGVCGLSSEFGCVQV